MKSEQLLAAFTPSIMSHETLEAIFVRREALATKLMDNLRLSVTTDSKRHAVLVGPRGIGKTYLVSLLYHRVKEDEELRNGFRVAWLREENWEVTSFLDLLESILTALATEYEDKILLASITKLNALSSTDAEVQAEHLLLNFLANRVLLLIVENLDELFASIEEIGQRQFRAFLQNHANTVLVATTPSLFYGVSDHDAPFYNFFNVTHLDELKLDDAILLLGKIANLRNDQELAAFIRTDTGHDRLQAVQHLAGGHPRIWIFFAGIVTEEALEALVPIFLQMLDDLTPYYQSRMKELPPQQRKIVAHLCATRSAVPVKDIAEACRLGHSQTAAQLHDLRKKAFVRSEAIGRESWYELNEPLMRLVFEIKESRGRPIRLIVDFLRRWYNRSERRAKYEAAPLEARTTRLYVEAALDLKGFSEVEPYIRETAPRQCELNELINLGGSEEALTLIEDSIEREGKLATAQHWFSHGYCLSSLQRYDEALKSLDRAIELNAEDAFTYKWRGFVLENLGRYVDALGSFDKAIEFDPSDSYPHYRRGKILDTLEHYVDALASFDKAIELAPKDSHVYSERGNTLNNLERYIDALESFNRAIKLNPSDPYSYSRRGQAFFWLERYNEAIESFDIEIELDPNHAFSYEWRGLAFNAAKNFTKALSNFDKAIELDAMDSSIYSNRGNVLNNLERYADALESFDKAIELDPTYAYPYIQRGLALFELKRYIDALANLDKAIELAPRDSDSHSNRGVVLGEQERYADALESFDKAIELDPNNPHPYVQRGHTLNLLHHYADALANFDKAIELDPMDSNSYSNKGVVLTNLKRYTDALECFDKAIELNPSDAFVYSRRGTTLAWAGQFDEALESINRAIELDPMDYKSHSNRGATLSSQKRYAEALESFNKAIELHPGSPHPYHRRGQTLYRLGHYDKALDDFNKALELNPREALFHIWRGIGLYSQDDYSTALESFDRAIELVPTDSRAYNARGYVLNTLKRYKEALTSTYKAIELDPNNIFAYLNRAQSYLACEDWPNFLIDLQKAFEIVQVDTDIEGRYADTYCRLLFETSDPQMWLERVRALVQVYGKYRHLEWLGKGLTESLEHLFETSANNEVTDSWNSVWQTTGAAYTELEISLRLLDAATQWRRKPNRRILLRLPVEERKVLEQMLPTQKQTGVVRHFVDLLHNVFSTR